MDTLGDGILRYHWRIGTAEIWGEMVWNICLSGRLAHSVARSCVIPGNRRQAMKAKWIG